MEEAIFSYFFSIIIILVLTLLFCYYNRNKKSPLYHEIWHDYFDTRLYLDPKLQVPLRTLGIMIASKKTGAKKLSELSVESRYGLCLNSEMKRFLKKWGPDRVRVTTWLTMENNRPDLFYQLIVMDNRKNDDVLTFKEYVKICVRYRFYYNDNMSIQCVSSLPKYHWTSLYKLYMFSRVPQLYEPLLPNYGVSAKYLLNDFYSPKKELLVRYFENILSGRVQKMFIVGEPGTGKTTFVNKIRNYCPGLVVPVMVTGTNFVEFSRASSLIIIDEFDKFLTKLAKDYQDFKSVLIKDLKEYEPMKIEMEKKLKLLDDIYYANTSIILVANNFKLCQTLLVELKCNNFMNGFLRPGRFEPFVFSFSTEEIPDICDYYMPTLSMVQRNKVLHMFKKVPDIKSVSIIEFAELLGYRTNWQFPVNSKDLVYKPTSEVFEECLKRYTRSFLHQESIYRNHVKIVEAGENGE